MSVSDDIHKTLADRFSPSFLEVIDQSHLHSGHAGAREGGESHFRVKMVSAEFSGANRLARHRMVNDTLAEPLKEQIHALALVLRDPTEDGFE